MLRLPKLAFFGFFIIVLLMMIGSLVAQAEGSNVSGELEPVGFLPIISKSGEATHTIVDIEPINPDLIMYGIAELGAWEKHHWTLFLTTSEVVTISVAAESPVDAVIAIFDSDDNLLIEQNGASTGQLEEITQFAVNPDESYTLEIYDEDGTSGAYFLTITGDQTQLVLSSRGILDYGDTGTGHLPEEHRHFWYFNGEIGETIAITTTAESGKLLLISLYDEEANLVQDENGDPIQFYEAEVTDVMLPETGLYLIWLEELLFEATDYSIYLTEQ